MRIKRFNESAGQGWRMLDDDEMERMMSRDRIDDFTQGEIDLVIGLARAFHLRHGHEVRVVEFHHLLDLSVSLFGESATKIRSTGFPEGAGWSTNDGPTHLDTNNLFIGMYPNVASVDILKSADSYFYVFFHHNPVHPRIPAGGYVCDEMSGLVALLKEIMDI